jgi:hypothetical protein
MAKRNMGILKSRTKRRGPGRPPKPDAANRIVPVRLSEKAIRALDKWGDGEGMARSAAARLLIERGLGLEK